MLGIQDRHPGVEIGAALLHGRTRSWIRPSLLRSTEWVGVFEGHEVRVVTRGCLQARLYIDGELLDARCALQFTDRKTPLLTGRVPGSRRQVTIVHVYRRGLWPMCLDVRVGGRVVPMNARSSVHDGS